MRVRMCLTPALAVVTLALALPNAACRRSAPEPEQRAPLSAPSLEVRLVEARQPGERLPLIVFLHGLGSSAEKVLERLPLAEMGERSRVHLLVPNGTLDGQGRRFWNAGPACCDFDQRRPDDVARLGALLDTWAARPEVDADRIYLMGISNGGFMAMKLACERSRHVAAVAAFSGALEKPADCPGLERLSVLMVHGDADEIVSYAAGRVFGDARLSTHLSAADGFREWGRRLGCAGEPVRAGDAELDPDAARPPSRLERFTGCAAGDAALLTVTGGPHNVVSRTGVLRKAWGFLLQHRKH
jgi:polyhydroxybutyrate depolymerase